MSHFAPLQVVLLIYTGETRFLKLEKNPMEKIGLYGGTNPRALSLCLKKLSRTSIAHDFPLCNKGILQAPNVGRNF